MSVCVRWLAALSALCSSLAYPQTPRDTKGVDLWSLKPVVRPRVPAGVTAIHNPIDAFIAAGYAERRADARWARPTSRHCCAACIWT